MISLRNCQYATTLVQTHGGPPPEDQATGFWYRDERSELVYLVTARHVCLDEGKAHRPDFLSAAATSCTDNRRRPITIPLHDGERRWLEFGDDLSEDSARDVALLPLPE